ncbi:MAG: TraC family protein, partial [Dehalococcoidia bacterium]
MRFPTLDIVSTLGEIRQRGEALLNEFQYFLAAPKGKTPLPRRLDRRRTDKPLTHAEVREWYQRPLSFTRYLPWVDYLEEDRCVLLEDGQSVGAFFELIPVGCEARPQ